MLNYEKRKIKTEWACCKCGRLKHWKTEAYILYGKYEETSSTEMEEQKKLLKDIEHQLGIFRREYEDVYRQYRYMKKDFRDYTTRNNENRLKTLKDLQKD